MFVWWSAAADWASRRNRAICSGSPPREGKTLIATRRSSDSWTAS